MKHRHAIAACARWEEQHIQEWLEYHRAIGFDHVYLYCNDDDPRALLSAVQPHLFGPDPFVTFRHWPVAGQQAEMHLHFLDTFKRETEWFAFLDVDEFLLLRGVDDVAAFMAEFEDDTDCLYLNWLNYGAMGKLRRDDAPVLTSHLRRAALPEARTKMICRSAAVDAAAVRAGWEAGRGAFWHSLDGCAIPGLRGRDVLHGNATGCSSDLPGGADAFAGRPGVREAMLAKAVVAHFQIKSEADFVRRWRRGGLADDGLLAERQASDAQREVLARRNAVYDTYLAAFWVRHARQAAEIPLGPPAEPPDGPNAALHKPSWQSSVFEPGPAESARARVAGAGNNGVLTGLYGFHTREEERPWWIVDLLEPHRISSVRLYNRIDHPALAARAHALDVMVSDDASRWTVIHRQDGPFGGADGAPAAIRLAEPVTARFVVLRLRGRGILHLDEVEVFGEPAT